MTRKFSFPILVLLLCLLSTHAFAWKFAVLGDSRGGKTGVRTEVLSPIIRQINNEKVDLVLFVGDAVNGSHDDAKLSAQMDTWIDAMKKLNCPWYYTPGNHEISSPASEKILCAKIRQPANGPNGYKGMVYSFDHQNAHFVSLNSNHHGEDHRVQSEWLAKDLATTQKPIRFVMAHEPAFSVKKARGLDCVPKERDDFWQIMSQAGVSAYFCGHEHLYARTRHGNLYQIISGTCGAPIKKNAPGTIGQFNYVVVEIDGQNVHCKAKTREGAVIDSVDFAVPLHNSK